MYQKYQFSNGLKLITVPIQATETVTILVLFPVGSRYETKKINGVSHFVEHMMFKGTKNRPNNLAIAKELDAIGAEYNAFTGKNLTGYWTKLDKDYIETGLGILADMLLNSLFDKIEFGREKGVILEEIKMYEDNPLMYIEDLFEQTLYGEHPLGWSIAGKIANIKNLKHQELLNFKKQHYQANQVLIAVAGNIKPVSTKNLIDKFFVKTDWSKQKKSGPIKFKKFLAKKQKKPILKTLTKDVQQIQFALGFPSYSYFHPQLETLFLLSIILGGNMSSRLFSEVREKRGLAYYVRADANPYQDTGNFVVRAGVDRDKINEAVGVVLDELKKVKDNGVKKEELIRAKTFFEGKLSLSLEDSAEVAIWYARRALLTSKTLTPEQMIAKIKKISQQDILTVARQIFKSSTLNLALIGPKINQSSLLSVCRKRL